jgi:hypothetical protein
MRRVMQAIYVLIMVSPITPHLLADSYCPSFFDARPLTCSFGDCTDQAFPEGCDTRTLTNADTGCDPRAQAYLDCCGGLIPTASSGACNLIKAQVDPGALTVAMAKFYSERVLIPTCLGGYQSPESLPQASDLKLPHKLKLP